MVPSQEKWKTYVYELIEDMTELQQYWKHVKVIDDFLC